MKSGKYDVFFAILIAVAAAAAWQHEVTQSTIRLIASSISPQEKPYANKIYVCAGNKSFQVLFYSSSVHLHLSTGEFILPQTSARIYATSSGLVFIDENAAVSIQENGTTTYRDCVVGINNYS